MKDYVRTRIRRYLEQDGRCHWCKGKMVLIVGYNPYGWSPPDNMATLDHLHSKLSPGRSDRGGYKNVAACAKCNRDRAAREEQDLGAEELRRRAGRRPCPMHSPVPVEHIANGTARFGACTCDRGPGGS